MARTLVKLLILLFVFFAMAGASAYLTLTFIIESEETVVVPELKGKNAITVLELLSDLGLNTKVTESEYHPGIPENHVLHQEPEPGTVIKKDRDVKVVLSKGTRKLQVPDLTGVSRQQAEVILANNGLDMGVVSAAYSQSVKADMVIAHTPAFGQEVIRGERVDLLVSRGPRPQGYVMPELEGKTLDQALAVLEEYGLSVGGIGSAYQSGQPANIIIEQAPLSGYYVSADQEIKLTVNRSPAPTGGAEGTSAYGTSADILFRYQVPPGFLKQHIRVELKAFGMSSTLYDELMQPGRVIWVMIPKYTHSVVFLYRNNELIETEVYNR